MDYRAVFLQRKALRFVVSALIILSFISFLLVPRHARETTLHLSPTPVAEDVGDKEVVMPPPPSDYVASPQEAPLCANLFGMAYLENTRDVAAEYCAPQSPSTLTCFHNQASGSRVDTFCLAQGASFNSSRQKFALDCELQQPSKPDSPFDIPQYGRFENYWYNTGPNVVFNNLIDLQNDSSTSTGTPLGSANFTILVNREGATNPWHTLMEIFSMTMTIDVLQMSRDVDSERPLFTAADIDNTQVLIMDNHENGPFFDLWSLFAKRPALRLHDLNPNLSIEPQNLIIPLAGGSNPLWQGDWEPHSCKDSPLLRTFSSRVLDFYGLKERVPEGPEIVVTFINRTGSRRLTHSEEYLQAVEADIPHTRLQSFDFATMSLERQLDIVRGTDVLVGVHGAGLTHGIFLSQGSSMVEILPAGLNHKGFRNMASLMGHSYFSTHAARASNNDWHNEDVFLENDRFMDIMNIAIKAVYNKGGKNFDAV
ncbi:hypothetical protein BDV38DRAFT_237599 [Aspergillus pseudotamarii]|uniref:EGF domain-specific O-linked N-acetylglucosamine transferase n=1 Tax=Aspergillus pseudotamarii TaxID=132259 RepID=A0A5N6T4K3_ASPPS|nr:uncharacterized protein BDV38DRAFT_237599 [Aspergillus pseudotamarii]KAE8141235.1 hypothetical protein BDV38DRAFT_237599 [Aspergillus pseudotamarii]